MKLQVIDYNQNQILNDELKNLSVEIYGEDMFTVEFGTNVLSINLYEGSEIDSAINSLVNELKYIRNNHGVVTVNSIDTEYSLMDLSLSYHDEHSAEEGVPEITLQLTAGGTSMTFGTESSHDLINFLDILIARLEEA